MISEGERQQVLLARLLMGEPGAAAARRAVRRTGPRCARAAARPARRARRRDPATPPIVLVTHHVEEIPPGTTHALVLAGGRVVSAGPIDDALTPTSLSAAFDFPVELGRDGDRWWARAHP